MTVRAITKLGDPILRAPTRRVTSSELVTADCQALIDDLIETMRAANGAGIAANQIGDPRRICVIEVRPGNPRYPYKPPHPLTVLVNPVLEWQSEARYDNNEGCLSVPDLRGDLTRSVEVVVSGYDRDGGPVEHHLRGLTAGTAQHEVDHLDGIVFVDRVDDPRSLSTWEEFQKHRAGPFEARIRKMVEEMT